MATIIPLAVLGGCASFSGMPEPVLPAQTAVNMALGIPIDEALQRFHAATDDRRNGLDRASWRNFVVALYMAAADARYSEFRSSLAREARGSNFGLDLGILALSAGGTLAGQSTANALAAATAGLTGTRSTINRELYFDRTLPALVAAMDAARLEVRTEVHRNLLGRSADEYPLELALSDVAAYERAASLDQAVQRVTVAAADDVSRQQRIYETIQTTAPIIADAEIPLVRRVTDNITAVMRGGDATKMQQISEALGQPTANVSLQEQAVAAIRAVTRLPPGELQQIVDELKTRHSIDLGGETQS